MSSLRDLKARARVSYGVIAGMLVFAYFIYHSVEGDRGLLALNNVNVRIAEAEKKLAELVVRERELEGKVIRLTPSSLDRDFLEERGRKILNFGHDNDIVIVIQNQSKKS
jgi:cell division protein FtsB|tara:strand:+ start:35 stop:364 length:330 start_codon:yes stop_codon:yes gene_type:complete